MKIIEPITCALRCNAEILSHVWRGEIIGLLPGSQIIDIYNLFTNDLRSLIVNEAWNQVANILADLLIDAGLSFSVSRIVAELDVGAANCAFFE